MQFRFSFHLNFTLNFLSRLHLMFVWTHLMYISFISSFFYLPFDCLSWSPLYFMLGIQKRDCFHPGASFLSYEDVNIKEAKPVTSRDMIKGMMAYIWPKVIFHGFLNWKYFKDLNCIFINSGSYVFRMTNSSVHESNYPCPCWLALNCWTYQFPSSSNTP